MGIVKEFKQFAMKGSVVDMAVGIIIGAAFGKIVSSFVADVIMPPIGMLVGGITFTDIVISLRHAVTDPATGKIIKEAVNLKLGTFIQTVFDFLIVAFAIFMMIKGMNRMKKKEEEAPAAPAEPTAQEKLLTEIRDLLKK